jgi:hypothetical protein
MADKHSKVVEELEVDTLTKMEESKCDLPKSKGTTTRQFNSPIQSTSHLSIII